MAIIESFDDYKKLTFEDVKLSANKLFHFDNYQEWVNRATILYSSIGLSERERSIMCIALDKKGRLCRRGGDFMRARDENQFPVSVYIMECTI